MSKLIDLRGQTFGRLVVLDEEPDRRTSRAGTKLLFWKCECRCGQVLWVRGVNLRSGNTQSCGCWPREIILERNTTHGKAYSAEYDIWHAMMRRCSNLNNSKYGARGITVCERWTSSFAAFWEDMGPRPGPEYSINRIKNDGPYCKENCEWATPVTQANNTRRNRWLAWDGRTQTVAQWARELGMNEGTLRDRLRNGWSVQRALTHPVGDDIRHRRAR